MCSLASGATLREANHLSRAPPRYSRVIGKLAAASAERNANSGVEYRLEMR